MNSVPKDQIRTKADKKAIDEGCYFDEQAADRAVKFIETFCLPSSGRKAKDAFRLFKWQRDVVRRLFGWMRADDTRRFRKGYISVARQNGKSALCAWISLYMMLADGEVSAVCASAACSREQAGIVFDYMKFCIENNPKLQNACVVTPSKRLITAPKANATYKSLSVEASTSLGPSISCCILDEFAFHRNGKLAAALTPALAARENPLMLAITTAGTNMAGPGYDEYLYACKVRDGASEDTSYFAAIYEADEGCKVDDVKQWHKANPSLSEGTLTLEELKDQATMAIHSKSQEVQFRYFRLNRWTQGITSFLSLDKWDACKGSFPNLQGCPAYIGLDLASSKDLAGLACLVCYADKLYLVQHAWAPQAANEKRQTDNKQRYDVFASEGTLTLSDGNGTDYRKIRDYIKTLSKLYDIKEVIGDPNAGCNETLMALADDGFICTRFNQSPKNYNDPTRRLETLVLDRKLVHDGSNLMRWQIQNLQVEITSDDFIKPAKGKSSDKIDNVCALIMAISRAGLNEVLYKPTISVYEHEGLFLI